MHHMAKTVGCLSMEGQRHTKMPNEKMGSERGAGTWEDFFPTMSSSPEGRAWSIMALATNSINSDSCSE